MPKANDNLDKYRDEYNRMLIEQATNSNSMVQEKFLTISINKNSLDEARQYFTRISAELNNRFRELGSKVESLSANERLRVIHDFIL